MPEHPYHYVYLPISESDPSRHYTGCTQDLQERLRHHNDGSSPHTARFRPWRLDTAVAFRSPARAAKTIFLLDT